MNKYVSGAIGVEVALNPNVPRIYLPDLPYLRNKRIKHIDFFSHDGVVSKSPTGKDLVSITDEQLYLTLVEQNTQQELIRDIAVVNLTTYGNRLFINKIIDMQRSYINMAAVTNPVSVTNKSAFFVFWYDEPAIYSPVPNVCKTRIDSLELKLTGHKTFFADNRTLLDKKYQNLLLSFPNITPKGNESLTLATCGNKFLTLKRGNMEFFRQIPLMVFAQNEDYYQLRLQNIQFDLQNSYIESLGVTAGDLKTVFFNVILDDNK